MGKIEKIFAVSIFLVIGLFQFAPTFAKPITDNENLNFHDVTTKLEMNDFSHHQTESFEPEYSTDFVTTDLGDSSYVPDNKSVSFNKFNSSLTTWGPVFEKFNNVSVTSIPDPEEADDLLKTLEPEIGDLSSLVITSKTDSWTPDSLVTTSASVSGGIQSSVTSLESDSGEADSLVTNSESGNLPTALVPGTKEPDSFTTNLKSSTNSLATIFKPDFSSDRFLIVDITPKSGLRYLENVLETVPIKNERSNGASAIGASFIVIPFVIFFISPVLRVT